MRGVVVVSGGLDSVVLLHWLDHEVEALTFDYGQRHDREIACAREQAEMLGVPWHLIDLRDIGRSVFVGSALTDPAVDVPEGHYEEPSMKATVVPNRNMVLLSIAVAHAIARRMDFVAYGAHAGDRAIYPDCRPEFTDALAEAIMLADWHSVELWRPFLRLSKSAIVKFGADRGVDFSKTWTCYKGLSKHCGVCGACVERKEAFIEAGVPDPTEYDA